MSNNEKTDQTEELFTTDPMVKESLCFKEVLIIATKDGNQLGEVCINVENMPNVFVVHISSQHVYHHLCPAECSGAAQKLSITSEVDDTGFLTKEEYRHEYSSCGCKEKSLYASEIQGKYFVSTQSKICDDITWDETYDISTDENQDVERVSTQLDDIDQEVIQITRTIYGPRKEPQILVTILTEVGQILQHNWDDSELIMTVDPKNPILNSRVRSLGRTRLECIWEEDMMLNSLYLDKVVELKNIFQSYLEDYKEISQIVCDFLKDLLLGKPEDPVSFAEEYFIDFYDNY